MSNTVPHLPPKEPGRWRAALLAALVHAALFAFLWFGVRWQNDTPVTIEAEVWNTQVREAAPRPQPEPEPETQEKPAPAPVIKEPPKPAVVEPPVEKPDIALEQEKKRKARERKIREEEARLEQKRMLEQKRIEEKKAEEKRAHEKLVEKEKADAAAKKKLAAEAAKKEAAEKKRKEEAEEAQRLAKVREEEMRRITGSVSAVGGSGEAAKREGGSTDSSYAQKIGARIKSNISFILPANVDGNAPAEYKVDLLPDGSVAGMRLMKSSGVPGFDEAVRRAIEKSQPYPKDKTGKVPSSFIGTHRPKDQ